MAPSDLTDLRLPPQNLDAEQSVLGAILLDNASLSKAFELITEEDFYRGAHRLIYQAMVELAESNEVVDQITLTAILKSKGQLEQIGGGAYVAELVQVIPRFPTCFIIGYSRCRSCLRQTLRALSSVARTPSILLALLVIRLAYSASLTLNGTPLPRKSLSPLNEHRHDHMNVSISTNRPENSWTRGRGNLKGYLSVA